MVCIVLLFDRTEKQALGGEQRLSPEWRNVKHEKTSTDDHCRKRS